MTRGRQSGAPVLQGGVAVAVAAGILAPCCSPIPCAALCRPIPVYGLDLPPLLHQFAAKSISICRQIHVELAANCPLSRTVPLPFTQPDFHLRRNENRHFTFYLQGRDDFQNLQVSLERTADGKVKTTITPEGSPASFFQCAREK